MDDLLDVARIVGGKIDLKPERCDVGKVMRNAVEIAESLVEQLGQQLTVSVPDSLTWWGDPARLAQIVSNLLTNAARYTPSGGRIELSVLDCGDDMEIRVVDDGEGMSPELMARVFDPFFQGRQGMDREQGGLGLGLTLTKNLVNQHGGTVAAASDGPGLGSMFVVRLPLTASPERSSAAKPSTEITPKRILLVDDNRDAASLLRSRLESVGHRVEVAHDGLAALDAFTRYAPEVAILDIGLPVMDGYELARRMAEMQGGKGCQLIALTGYAQPADKERSAAAGFHAHLVKPVSFDSLCTVLAD